MSADPLDLVGLLVAVFAFVVSKEIAATVGPYAAILVLACAGAAISLSGHEKMRARDACWYVTWRAFVAIAVTVMLAELVQIGFAQLKPRYTIAPIAFLIGWIKDYNEILRSASALIGRVLQRKADGQ